MKTTVVIIVTLILSQYFLHNIIKMLCNTDKQTCSSANYRGNAIPAIGGMVFIPILLVAILLLLLSGEGNAQSYMKYLTLVLSMGFIGVIDDLVGDRRTKGISNHISRTLKGFMTTGFLKAFTGFAVSCIISLTAASTYVEFIVNVLIISLSANTINLFDLRPGRAVKVFTAASLIILSGALKRFTEAVPIVILNGAALLYLRYDLNEVCMLGDTGSNILGITLGYYSVQFFGMSARFLLLALLVSLNIMSERMSISDLINRSRVLSYIDSIGKVANRKGDRYN